MIRDPIETFGQYWVWGVAVIFMAIWVIKFPREVYNIIDILGPKINILEGNYHIS